MDHSLIRYASKDVPVPWSDRAVAGRAKTVYDDARLTALKADASLALGAHIMVGVTALDSMRKQLASDDMGLNMLLADVMVNTVRQVSAIQRSFNDPWSL